MVIRVLHTLLSKLLLTFVLLLFSPLLIVFLLLPKKWITRNRLFFCIIHAFYWSVIKCSFLPITFKGLENIPKKAAIFAANHQSSLDIPLIGYLLKSHPHVWLAKKELEESFFIRFLLPLLAITVDISSPLTGMRTLISAIKLANGDNGKHIMIFPEGGRFTDAKVHDFFSGFVILAKKTGRAVVPVKIIDAYKVYPPDAFLVQYHPIKVVVGKPFILLPDESDEAFKTRVYEWFVNQT